MERPAVLVRRGSDPIGRTWKGGPGEVWMRKARIGAGLVWKGGRGPARVDGRRGYRQGGMGPDRLGQVRNGLVLLGPAWQSWTG